MGKLSWKTWTLVCVMSGSCLAACAADLPTQPIRSELIQPVAGTSQKSWTDSVSSSVKKGFDSVTGVFKPSPKRPVPPPDDPVSLKNKARVSPQTRAAMAKLFEDAGRFEEAAEQYRQALAESPKDVRTLLGYARLKARTGDLVEATRLFEQALTLSPSDPAVLNNLAMCLAQRKMHKEAVGSLQQAVQLQPGNPLYRNNLAAVLIEVGQNDAALAQLQATNSEAVARYNLGYLLKKNGQVAEAARQFALAAKLDPSLTQAQYWAGQLGNAPSAQPTSQQAPSVVAHPYRSVVGGPMPSVSPTDPAVQTSPVRMPNGSMPSSDDPSSLRLGQNKQFQRLPPLSPDADFRR